MLSGVIESIPRTFELMRIVFQTHNSPPLQDAQVFLVAPSGDEHGHL